MDRAKGPTRAYGQLKRMLAASAANSFAEQLDLEASHQERAAASVDFKEGVAAFVGKRRANFTGA
ncbi:MAG: hypothetical protein Q8R02_08835 [Hyphomonadaceae bacterium]|nr:hypothetical protein [Hyphomonadaceae bacterium]